MTHPMITRDYRRICVVLALCLVTCAGQTFAEDDELHRWAIIASAEISKSGIADLLTSELSKQDDFKEIESMINVLLKEVVSADKVLGR